jgi:hypothetical protein
VWWILVPLALGAAIAALVLWASRPGRLGKAGSPAVEGAPGGDIDLEQRILSIEKKIEDLATLRKVVEDGAGGDLGEILVKQDRIAEYLVDYHDRYQGLILERTFIEGAEALLSGGLEPVMLAQGIAELRKEIRQRHQYLRAKPYSTSHRHLDARLAEIDTKLESLLRRVVVEATNQIIASESPLSRVSGIPKEQAEVLVGDGKASEEKLNREYDRFLSEIELS